MKSAKTKDRLIKLIVESNIDLARIAHETGILVSKMSMWKEGKRSLGVDDSKVLSAYFNVSIDYLLCLTDDPKRLEKKEKTILMGRKR